MQEQGIRVLVLCDDFWHPAEVIRQGLMTFSEQDIRMDFIQDAKDMLSVELIRRYDVIMNCKCNQITSANTNPWFEPGVTEVGPEEFRSYVQAGGGFLSVHSGNSFAKEQDAAGYTDFTGCYFVKHPPRCDVQVLPTGTHPITEGVGPFTIRDEHYELAVTARDAVQILETRSDASGIQMGGYVRTLGKGRICVLAPGHILSVWENKSYRKILAQAIRWCSGRLQEEA